MSPRRALFLSVLLYAALALALVPSFMRVGWL